MKNLRVPGLAVAFVFMIFPAVARAQTALVMPFELTGNRIYVPAHVNGQGPYRFMIDNGASGVGRADVRLVEALALPSAGTTSNSDGVNTSLVAVVQVESLRLGSIERRDVQLLSRDYNRNAEPGRETMGILGQGFFEDGLLEIDFHSRILRFTPGGRLNPDEAGVMAYGEDFTIPIRIGEHVFEGSLDTGSSLSLHLPQAVLEASLSSPPEPAGEGRRANTVFTLSRATLLEPVTIGGLVLNDLSVVASPQAPRINIGLGVLGGAVLELDQHNRLLAIVPAPDN